MVGAGVVRIKDDVTSMAATSAAKVHHTFVLARSEPPVATSVR